MISATLFPSPRPIFLGSGSLSSLFRASWRRRTEGGRRGDVIAACCLLLGLPPLSPAPPSVRPSCDQETAEVALPAASLFTPAAVSHSSPSSPPPSTPSSSPPSLPLHLPSHATAADRLEVASFVRRIARDSVLKSLLQSPSSPGPATCTYSPLIQSPTPS